MKGTNKYETAVLNAYKELLREIHDENLDHTTRTQYSIVLGCLFQLDNLMNWIGLQDFIIT